MKRTMISKEEFDILVKKAVAIERDDVYEKGRNAGWQEGYDEGYQDANHGRDVEDNGW